MAGKRHRHRSAHRSEDAARLGSGASSRQRNEHPAGPVPARPRRAAGRAQRGHRAADGGRLEPLWRLRLRRRDGERRREPRGRAADVRQGRPPGRRRLGNPLRPDAGPEGRGLGPEQAPVRHGGEDQQQHRRHAAHDPGSANSRHEPHRTLHPPARAGDGGQPPDPAARRAGADEPAGAPVSRGRRDDDHRHHRLYGRQRRPDAGLHHHADRQGGVERRGRRLRHLAEPARPQHGVGAHAPQHRPRSGADRGHRQGAAGPRAAAEPMRRTR